MTKVVVVHESASLLGPILLAAGAVAAAGITVLTANWRHRKQLEHDRGERNRDHIRDSIDAAVVGAGEAIHDVTSYVTESEHFHRWIAQLRKAHTIKSKDQDVEDPVGEPELEHPDYEEREQALIESLENGWAKNQKMRRDNLRLEIRLGKTHEIVREHDALREHLERWRGLAGSPNEDETKKEEIDPEISEIGETFARLRRACQVWFASDSYD